MPRFRFQRHLRTTLSAVALACCVALLPSLAADAAGPDTHDGERVAALRRSAPASACPVSIDVNLGAPAAATISSDGMLTIPKDAVALATDALDPEPVPGTAISRVDVSAVSDLIGWIDTNSGVMTLQGDLIVLLCRPRPRQLSHRTDARRVHDDEPRRPRDTTRTPSSATVTTSHEFGDPGDRDGGLRLHAPRAVDQRGARSGGPGRCRPSSSTSDSLQPRSPPPPPPPTRRQVAAPGTPSPPAASPTPPANAGTSPTHASAHGAERHDERAAPRPPPARVQRPRSRPPRRPPPRRRTRGPLTSTHDLLASPPARSEPPTTFGRTPIAAESPVPDDSAGSHVARHRRAGRQPRRRDRRLRAAPVRGAQAVPPPAARRVLTRPPPHATAVAP